MKNGHNGRNGRNRLVGKIGMMAVGSMLLAGCASGPQVDLNQAYAKLIDQPRVAPVHTLKWKGHGKFILEGDDVEWTISAPVPQISALPSNPTTAQAVLSTAKDVLLMGAGIWTMHDLGMALARRPQVVDRQIQEPFIYEAPAQ